MLIRWTLDLSEGCGGMVVGIGIGIGEAWWSAEGEYETPLVFVGALVVAVVEIESG